MPCTDWDDAEKVSASEYSRLIHENNRLEGMLCAVLSELEKDLGSLELQDFLMESTNEAKCSDLNEFWIEHRQQDLKRLEKEMESKFSKQEIEFIKNAIKNDNFL